MYFSNISENVGILSFSTTLAFSAASFRFSARGGVYAASLF
jgi:hypothetical protein